MGTRYHLRAINPIYTYQYYTTVVVRTMYVHIYYLESTWGSITVESGAIQETSHNNVLGQTEAT